MVVIDKLVFKRQEYTGVVNKTLAIWLPYDFLLIFLYNCWVQLQKLTTVMSDCAYTIVKYTKSLLNKKRHAPSFNNNPNDNNATDPCGCTNEEHSLLATNTKVRDIAVERPRCHCQWRWGWWDWRQAWRVINAITTNSKLPSTHH